jgi:hypothetical protein
MHTLRRQMNTQAIHTKTISGCAEHQIKEATPFLRLSHFFTDFACIFQRLAALLDTSTKGFEGGRPVNLHFCPPYIAIVIMDISLAVTRQGEGRLQLLLRVHKLLASIGRWNVFRRQKTSAPGGRRL